MKKVWKLSPSYLDATNLHCAYTWELLSSGREYISCEPRNTWPECLEKAYNAQIPPPKYSPESQHANLFLTKTTLFVEDEKIEWLPIYSKTRYISRSLSARSTFNRRMIFSWCWLFISCKNIISRKVRWASVEFCTKDYKESDESLILLEMHRIFFSVQQRDAFFCRWLSTQCRRPKLRKWNSNSRIKQIARICTPLPTFCPTSYFLRTCLSISSLICK
jgi:hypothetical protein